MATAESVKAKIQSLINAANAKTGKTDADLTAATSALIAGYGQGGGGGSGIIDVTELPTENINSDVIYRVTSAPGIFCLWNADTGRAIFLTNGLIGDADIPYNIEYFYVDAIPEEMQESAITESGLVLCVYVLREEGVGYVNFSGAEGIPNGVFTLGQIFETKDCGLSYDIERETVTGAYMCGSPVIARYVYFEGAWTKINPPEPDIWFKLNEDATSYSVSAHKEVSFEAHIPAEHNELPITDVVEFSDQNFSLLYLPDSIAAIGDTALSGCAKLSEIRRPDDANQAGGRNVISVGDFAFDGCFSLRATAIPMNLQTIGMYAFNQCYCFDGLPEWKNLTKIGSGAFANCPLIEETIIPDTINSWSHLGYLKMPSTVTDIGDDIFSDNVLIEQIRFLGKPTMISAFAFRNMHGLKDIYVPWSEGEVAGAPWGATNATIHYNYTE